MLSAGQRQLIALARAELVDTALLLLDKATYNLDLATEARVAAAMRQVSRDRTTVLIAHRLQTAQADRRIVVLDDGRVVEAGTQRRAPSNEAGPMPRCGRRSTGSADGTEGDAGDYPALGGDGNYGYWA